MEGGGVGILLFVLNWYFFYDRMIVVNYLVYLKVIEM